MNGLIYFTPDHQTLGDVWSGGVDVLVKVPERFQVKATYMNGRRDETNYWFAQIESQRNSRNSPDVGGQVSNSVEALENPVGMGVLDLMGLSGRLYHNMQEGQPHGNCTGS